MTRRDGTDITLEFIAHDTTSSSTNEPFVSHLTLVVDNRDPKDT